MAVYMKKTKKNKPRPMWACNKCRITWISCECICMICKGVGVPLNESAEKIANKAKGV